MLEGIKKEVYYESRPEGCETMWELGISVSIVVAQWHPVAVMPITDSIQILGKIIN